MHNEDIKAAIRKTGITCEGLSLEGGFASSAVRTAMYRPWPRVEALIGARIGIPPYLIWPSRYDVQGSPLRGLRGSGRKDNDQTVNSHRQNRKAA